MYKGSSETQSRRPAIIFPLIKTIVKRHENVDVIYIYLCNIKEKSRIRGGEVGEKFDRLQNIGEPLGDVRALSSRCIKDPWFYEVVEEGKREVQNQGKKKIYEEEEKKKTR